MKKEIQLLNEETLAVAKYTSALSIKGAEDMKNAVETLSSLNTLHDRVVEDREKLTKPLLEALKEVRERYRDVEERLKASIGTVRSEMTRYQGEALKARQEAELKLSERVGEGRGKLKMETALRRLEEVEVVEKGVVGEAGSVTFVEVEKFEVVDFKALPDEYKVANEVAIRLAKKNGVEVAGVRYWKEQSVRNRR